MQRSVRIQYIYTDYNFLNKLIHSDQLCNFLGKKTFLSFEKVSEFEYGEFHNLNVLFIETFPNIAKTTLVCIVLILTVTG